MIGIFTSCLIAFLIRVCASQAPEQCIKCSPSPVDYDRVSEMIDTKIHGVFSELTARLNVIEEKLTPTPTTVSPLTTNRVACDDLSYKRGCFKVIQKNTHHRSDAEALCRNIGWKLANIYDIEHYQELEKYIRSQPVIGAFWTGMEYSVEERQIYLRSGKKVDLTGIRWFPNYPVNSDTRYSGMAILVLRIPNDKSQGIHNYPPSYRRTGAICEQ